ncbi:hypothetical protein BpHYR1_029423 [Brachionus plicatilis]|uniref:Uncharacterized protein n=1 Tax=Brachionus plicatilis TaxID=10195 RepID=A0A3M7PRB8_BRAPC|nr:hypothetical protein BpHYR1_029423 [Brachionus plicatilis]
MISIIYRYPWKISIKY